MLGYEIRSLALFVSASLLRCHISSTRRSEELPECVLPLYYGYLIIQSPVLLSKTYIHL